MNKNKRLYLILVFLLIFKSLGFCGSDISKYPVASTIAGEAGGEGYKGMYAVACVIQNRSRLYNMSLEKVVSKQFYGKDTPYAKKIFNLKKEEILGIVKLLESGQLKDITGGATHFENVERFGMPKYISKNPKRWKVTCKIGHHTFFKEKKI